MDSILAITDIARNIAPYLDDATIQKLYVLGLIPSLSQLSSDQMFWYERTHVLANAHLHEFVPTPHSSDVCWKETYQLLLVQLERADYPDFYNSEDNAMVAQLLGYVYPPCTDELRRTAVDGKPNILRYLLGRNDFNGLEIEVLQEKEPFLVMVARNGHSECVQLLLTRPELDPNILNENFMTPLMAACLCSNESKLAGYTEIVRMLLSDERTTPELNHTPELIACVLRAGDIPEMVGLLLSHPKLWSDEAYNYALQKAVALERRETAQMLLQTWPDTPLEIDVILGIARYIDESGIADTYVISSYEDAGEQLRLCLLSYLQS